MKLSDAFPSKWLSSDDLEDGDLIVTIDDNPPVEWQEFTEKGKPTPQNKPVMQFSHPRGLKPLILKQSTF